MKKIGLLLAGVLLCAPLLALEVPAPTGKYVSDFADLLSPQMRSTLEERLTAFDRETSTQILVVTIPSLEGDTPEDFSIRLAEKWKPGSAKNDNGAILLVSKADRAVRIEVGYGLEGALPDALAKRIIENEIVPRFRGGDFDGGVDTAVAAMIKATKGEYAAADAEDPFEMYASALYWGLILYFFLPYVAYALLLFFGFATYGLPGLGVCMVIVIFLHLVRLAVFSKAFFNSSSSGRRSGHGGGWGGGYGGGGFSGGGFSGGGFSGGGGSFGGGGAGGRW